MVHSEIYFEQYIKYNTCKVIKKDCGDYEVKIHLDDKDREIALKSSLNYWKIIQYDTQGNKIFEQDSDGNWEKRKYKLQTILQYSDSTGVHWVRGKQS